MKENGRLANQKGMVYVTLRMGQFIKDSGRMRRTMDLVKRFYPMTLITRVILLMGRSKDVGSSAGLMDLHMKVNFMRI